MSEFKRFSFCFTITCNVLFGFARLRYSSKPTQFNASRLASSNSFVFQETKPRKLLTSWTTPKEIQTNLKEVHFLADCSDKIEVKCTRGLLNNIAFGDLTLFGEIRVGKEYSSRRHVVWDHNLERDWWTDRFLTCFHLISLPKKVFHT